MRTLTIAFFLALVMGTASAAPKFVTYNSELEAQAHCPYDVVV